MNPVLHTSRDVLTLRHVPSWLALTAASGAVNGGAFLLSERFVSHMTGTVTRLGTTFAWDSMLALTAFIAGAMTSVVLVQYQVLRRRTPRHFEAMVLVAVLIGLVGLLGGHDGWASFDEDSIAVLIGLAYAMGLLNATVASGTGALVRPTHLTGTATDLGVALASALVGAGTARLEAFQWAALRAAKIGSFALGGLCMVPLTAFTGHAAFAVPAGLIIFAAVSSFSRTRRTTPAPEGVSA